MNDYEASPLFVLVAGIALGYVGGFGICSLIWWQLG